MSSSCVPNAGLFALVSAGNSTSSIDFAMVRPAGITDLLSIEGLTLRTIRWQQLQGPALTATAQAGVTAGGLAVDRHSEGFADSHVEQNDITGHEGLQHAQLDLRLARPKLQPHPLCA